MTEPIEAVLGRVRILADDISGFGMSGNIRGEDLSALMAYVGDLQSRNVEMVADLEDARSKAGRRAKPKQDDTPRVRALNEILQVADEILQSAGELWGQSLPDAIEAWRKQQGIDMPDDWQAAIADALGGAT